MRLAELPENPTSSLQLWLTFLGILVVAVGGFAGIWIQARNRSEKTDAVLAEQSAGIVSAGTQATMAAEFAKPVSNGFTQDMRDGLAAIQREQEQARQREERAEEQRAADRRITEVALNLIGEHLGVHARSDVLKRETGGS